MQTFLPVPCFKTTAQLLDYRRLGKQRAECIQVLNALTQGTGWVHHPATKMWEGHVGALLSYSIHISSEWRKRGYRDTTLRKFMGMLDEVSKQGFEMPDWFGLPEFHESHQSNLVRKEPKFYKKLWPDVEENLPYYWPTQHERGGCSEEQPPQSDKGPVS